MTSSSEWINKSMYAQPEIKYEGNFLRLVCKGDWEYMERVNSDGIAIIVPVTDEGKTIFIDQSRVPHGKRVVEFPAGLIGDLDHPEAKDRESLMLGAQRELIEETGYEARELKELVSGPAASGSSTVIITFFLAKGLTKVGQGGGDETEDIVIHEVPVEEADSWLLRMEKDGYLVDPKVYTGLYFIKNYNRVN